MIIEVAFNQKDGFEFVEWLNKKGHEAKLGDSFEHYIDGESCEDLVIGKKLIDLWNEFKIDKTFAEMRGV